MLLFCTTWKRGALWSGPPFMSTAIWEYDTGMPILISIVIALLQGQNPWDIAKKAAGSAATGHVEKEINQRLLAEGRKNQCSFKTDSDQLMASCDTKIKNLAN